MTRSITSRLVVMFALGALATLTLIGVALYGVLERELTRHQNDELNTNLQNMRYSIERFTRTAPRRRLPRRAPPSRSPCRGSCAAAWA